MGGFETYLIQKNFNPDAPRSSTGQNVNIIHLSMLYWPEPTVPVELIRTRTGGVPASEVPPPVRVTERPHGEERLMNRGVMVAAI